MEEYVVIGVLLISCVVLGITMLDDTELRETESGFAETQFEWLGLEGDIPQEMTGRYAQVMQSFRHFRRDGETQDQIEAPKILARNNSSASEDNHGELSEGVLSRYRCFADDLSRLREELAYSPVRAATAMMQRQDWAEQSVSPAPCRVAVPIGAVFAQKRPLDEKLAAIRDQLPVAEPVSIRV